jgi:hypothetical protein
MFSASSTPSVNAAPARTSAAARLANVVVDPAGAFHGIGAAHPWALAIAAIIALRFVSLLIFYDPALTPLKVLASLAFQMAAVVPPLLVGSTLAWLVAKAWRLRVGWLAVFSICAHVAVAHALVTVAVASVAGALLPDSASVDVRHPPFTNLGFLFDSGGSAAVLHRLAREADVRSMYAGALLWLGLRAAEAPETSARPGVVAGYVVATLAVIRLTVVLALAAAIG